MKDEPQSQMLLYQTADGATRLEVRLEDETVCLSLNQLAGLFQQDKSVISRHIKNIYEEGKLKTEGTVAKICNSFKLKGGNRSPATSSSTILM